MPSADEILAGLQAISNQGFEFAVAWHLVVGAGMGALLLGWRPSPRLSGALLATPLVSVSAFAWAFHTPFNGAAFALLAAILAFIAVRTPLDEVKRHEKWATALGGVLVAFAWFYPHFLARAWIESLAGAPLGLIPCPTLSLVIGLSLMGQGPAGRGWGVTLGVAGLFYGLFGALRLGVMIDLVLLVGAVGLLVQAGRRMGITPMPHPSAH